MFSTRGCTSSGVLTFVTVFVCLCFCNIEGQTDGHLSCPDKWTRGDNIQLFCVMEIDRINNQCPVQVNETFFSLDGIRQCTINSTGFQQCSSPSSVSTPGCRCETNGTHFLFKYIFKALETHTGSWTCQKLCQDSLGFPITLNITSESACTTVVHEKPTKEAELTIIVIVLGVVLCLVLLSGGTTVIVVKIPVVIVIVVSQQEMEEFKRRWKEIVDFVHKNSKFCCCCVCGLMGAICCCCPLDVRVDYIGENVIKITLTARLIRFFCLRNMTPKVEDYARRNVGNAENL